MTEIIVYLKYTTWMRIAYLREVYMTCVSNHRPGKDDVMDYMELVCNDKVYLFLCLGFRA